MLIKLKDVSVVEGEDIGNKTAWFWLSTMEKMILGSKKSDLGQSCCFKLLESVIVKALAW